MARTRLKRRDLGPGLGARRSRLTLPLIGVPAALRMERQFGQTVIRVEQDDITALRVDAIVNAANDRLWMGGGVAGAIKRAGGVMVEQEAMAQGPLPVGEAVPTSAGTLPCRYVIHAVTMGQDLVTSAGAIRQATGNSLRRADELGLASIAFPALGTGVGGFSVSEAAQVMVGAITAHLRGDTALREVSLVAFSDEAVRAFESALVAAAG